MKKLPLDSEIEDLLDESERLQICASSTERRILDKLKRRAESGYLCCPISHLYVRSSYWSSLNKADAHLHLVRSLARLHPQWIFSYSSAALLHGLDVSYKILDTVHIMTSVESHSRDAQGIRHHFMHSGLSNEVQSIDGIRVTTLPRTVFDCSRYFPFELSLGIVDSALRNSALTPFYLLVFCDGKKKFRGVREARTAISYGNDLSENGGESFARARMISMGFAAPQLQKEFTDHITKQRYRADYVWTRSDGTTLIGEYHGMQKYIDPSMTKGKSLMKILSAETKRRSRISVNNTEVLDFDYEDVSNWHHFLRLLEQYRVPKRPGAHIGRPEFNCQLLA